MPIPLPAAGDTDWMDWAEQTDVAARAAVRAATPPPVGRRLGLFDRRSSLYLPTSASLRKLRAATAVAATGTTATDMLCLGDSKTAGTSATAATAWPARLRALLTGAGVNAPGTGIVPAQPYAQDNPLDPRWTRTGNWDAGTAWIHTSGSSGAKLTFTSDQPGTIVDAYFFNNSGSFSIAIDGAAAVAVTRDGSNTVGKYTVTGLANTTHTVVITATSNVDLFFIGVHVHPAVGLFVHNAGIPGISSDGFSDQAFPSNGFAYKAMVPAPAITAVALGVNDEIYGVTAAQVAANVQAIFAAFGGAGLLVVESHTAQYTPTAWAEVQSKLYDVADALDVPLLDIAERWGTSGQALGLLGGDNIHETAAGHAEVARAVARVLA